MKMTETFIPSTLLGQVYFPVRRNESIMADAVARVADEGFYQSVEIIDIQEPAKRRRIREIVHSNDLILTQWFVPLAASAQLDLSALDESLRKHSVVIITQQMNLAAECGAHAVAVASGPDPGPDLRGEATKAFYTSLCELAAAGQAYGLRIVVEPLDRGIHKDGLIGPTDEAVALMRRVHEEFCNVALCWDIGHIVLNSEDLEASLSASQPFITNIHFSNAVLDREHPNFGDQHLPIGPPGLVTLDEMAQVLRSIIDSEVFADNPPCVAVEICTTPGVDPLATWQLSKQTLQEAWNKATATGDSD